MTEPMIVYDTTTLAFIQKIEQMVREILKECGLTVRRSRFLWKNYLYPIHVVVFEGKEWGHFNAPYFQIALNRRQSIPQLREVLFQREEMSELLYL